MNKVFIFSVVLIATVHLSADPLFETDESLKLTFTAPFSEIYRARDKTKQYPARLLATVHIGPCQSDFARRYLALLVLRCNDFQRAFV